jgi:riboflavin biosynthesis pyrimidine reductase
LENVRKPWIVTTTDILTASNASEEILKVLKSKGATILTVPATPDGRVNLPALLNTLFTLGISRLMVEGGARIIEAFLRERLVDEVILTISPMWIGGLRAVANPLFDPSLPGQPNFPHLEAVTVEPCGSDWIVRGQLRS